MAPFSPDTQLLTLPPAPGLQLGPRVAQAHRAREHQPAGRGVAVEAKISGLGLEVAAMKEAARRESEAEAQRLAASGRAEAEKIKQAALAEQAAAERAARQELRALAASLAVERAGVLLGARMNADTRAKIFDQFVGELSRSVN